MSNGTPRQKAPLELRWVGRDQGSLSPAFLLLGVGGDTCLPPGFLFWHFCSILSQQCFGCLWLKTLTRVEVPDCSD